MSHHLPVGEWAIVLVLAVLAIGICLCAIRLARGPTLPDRVVAFDLITVHTMGIITAISILRDNWVLLDAVLILTLLAFLATVAFARYIMRAHKSSRRWPR